MTAPLNSANKSKSKAKVNFLSTMFRASSTTTTPSTKRIKTNDIQTRKKISQPMPIERNTDCSADCQHCKKATVRIESIHDTLGTRTQTKRTTNNVIVLNRSTEIPFFGFYVRPR
mmetsp:Transcript_3023/g.4411  ORF Transcript_3023/g.4411 Transcript_3023/m.4411 type:complete len:115 (-) Transcript_3023:1717-2061(-)